MCGPDRVDAAIGHYDFERHDVIGGGAVNRHVRAGGIVCDHSAESCASAGCHIRSETKSVLFEIGVQLIQDNAGPHANCAIIEVEIKDLPVVTRKIDNESLADGAAGQT